MDRRTALKWMGAAPLGAMLPNEGRAADAPPSRRFGIAVVGLGNYANYVLPRLRQAKRASLAGLVSGDGAKARRIADEHGLPADAIRDYRDFDRIADDPRIDAVHLCLPVGLHAEYTERALAAGKHVLCEKPLAASARDARRLIDTARRANRVLMPAYRARYSKVIQHALDRYATLGEPVAIDAHKGFAMTLPAGNWRFDPALAGGGSLFDIGPYSLQLTRWAAKAMPARVVGRVAAGGADPRFAKVEPHASWILEFDNGLVATGTSSWRYHLQNRARFAASRGFVDLDPATPGIGERIRISMADPARVEEPVLPLEDQVPAMYDDFAAAATEGRAPLATAEDGLADLVLIEAIMRSAREERPVALTG